jgi:hypothetical protein
VPATPFPGSSGNLLPTDINSSNDSFINSFCEYNGDLYVGGNFTGIGGVVAHGIARWNGSSWSSVGIGNFLEYRVSDMCIFNGELYFTSEKLYRWDGVNLELVTFPFYDPFLDSTLNQPIAGTDIHVFNNELYVIPGALSSSLSIIKYNGSNIVGIPFNSNSMGKTRCIEDFNNNIYLGTTKGLYRLDAGNWVNCNGVTTSDPYIIDLEKFQNELYVLGNYSSIGGMTLNHFAKYNGISWAGVTLPTGCSPVTGGVFLNTNNLGTNHLKTIGSELYFAHKFFLFGTSDPKTPLIKFNGSQWIDLALNYPNDGGGGAVTIYNNTLLCGGAFNIFTNYFEDIWYNGNFVRLSTPLGLENESLQSFSIFPNPTSDNITLSIPEQFIGASFTLCDQFGKIILTGNLNALENEINLETL